MSGGGSDTTTTTQTTEPWAAQKPFLESGFKRARDDVLNVPMEFFPGSTVVPYSPYTQQGIQGMAERAEGSPVVGAAQDELQKTLQGDYLSAGNPYMDAVAADIASQVMPQVQGTFAGAGRSIGGPLAQATASEAMTRAMAPYQFGAYADERNRMQNAAGMAPQLAYEDYRDLQALMGAGQMQEAKSAEELQDEINRFAFEQDEPRQRLEQYMRLISGAYGGTTIGDQLNPSGNPLMQGLGLAIGGAGALGGLGWSPFS